MTSKSFTGRYGDTFFTRFGYVNDFWITAVVASFRIGLMNGDFMDARGSYFVNGFIISFFLRALREIGVGGTPSGEAISIALPLFTFFIGPVLQLRFRDLSGHWIKIKRNKDAEAQFSQKPLSV